MTDIIQRAEPEQPPKTLAEQRLDLQLRLQINRRLLIHKFSPDETKNHFPRSILVRFLTQQTTLHLLKKVAYATIGVKIFNSVKYGFSLWQFVRHKTAQKH